METSAGPEGRVDVSTPGRPRERDALRATKLGAPGLRPELLVRQRLFDALEDGSSRDLTLVAGPAGFGKTTLLADWARRTPAPVAWLSLDADDNDPARFWRYAVTAIDRVRPGTLSRLEGILSDPGTLTADCVVTDLVGELERSRDRIVLVLDDYHVITTRGVHGSVAFLLDQLPAQLRLVVATRVDPPLALGRLRARGGLAELRAADLRFTTPEAVAFLQEVWWLDVTDDAVARLEARTEGWPAGLQLAALSLRGRRDATEFMDAFGESERYVLDYLTEEVLDRQEPRIREFLLTTSVVERLTASLCDALTGDRDGQELLETLERKNLFLMPLDGGGGWYRYHHLFADLLRARLEAADPGRARALNDRAAAWYEANGLIDEAVDHSLRSGEVERAARLVERNVEEVLRWNERATLKRWIEAIPESAIRARPRLRLAQAYGALLEGRIETLEALLDDTDGVPADAPHDPSIGYAASVLANVPATRAMLRADVARVRGCSAELRAAGEEVLSLAEEGRLVVRSLGAWSIAHADWLDGNLPEAERAFGEIVAVRRGIGLGYLTLRAAYDLGRVQQAAGRLRAAAGTYRASLDLDTAAAGPKVPAAGMMHLGLATVFLERDERDEALRHAELAVARSEHLAFLQIHATSLAVLGWARDAAGDAAGAREAMDEALRTRTPSEVCDLHDPVGAEWARLLVTSGDIGEAARWAARLGLASTDAAPYANERRYLTLARIMLAEGRPAGAALELLGRLVRAAQRDGRTGSVIESGALLALAHAGLGQDREALRAASLALALARPEGYVRVFLDAGPPMESLLRRFVATGGSSGDAATGPAELEFAQRLLRGFGGDAPIAAPGPPVDAPPSQAALRDPLTDRELEVLQLIALGRSNRQISDELVVTVDTTKKHITHILGKLGAANRTQAAARAREVGLLR